MHLSRADMPPWEELRFWACPSWSFSWRAQAASFPGQKCKLVPNSRLVLCWFLISFSYTIELYSICMQPFGQIPALEEDDLTLFGKLWFISNYFFTIHRWSFENVVGDPGWLVCLNLKLTNLRGSKKHIFKVQVAYKLSCHKSKLSWKTLNLERVFRHILTSSYQYISKIRSWQHFISHNPA
jgi:hypothetical protein